jgi:ATP adenylyltransferase
MKLLWAPWRIEYVQQAKPAGCIFCDKPKQKNDTADRILFRGKHNLVMMNNFPYNPGHLMVAPYRHLANVEELTADEKLEHFEIISRCVVVLKQALKPNGFNTGMNLGRTAGAGIDDHIHSHVVPRWNGDTNFMPVLGDVRVIPQSLDDGYAELKKYFE